jgi:hypothetical protein
MWRKFLPWLLIAPTLGAEYRIPNVQRSSRMSTIARPESGEFIIETGDNALPTMAELQAYIDEHHEGIIPYARGDRPGLRWRGSRDIGRPSYDFLNPSEYEAMLFAWAVNPANRAVVNYSFRRCGPDSPSSRATPSTASNSTDASTSTDTGTDVGTQTDPTTLLSVSGGSLMPSVGEVPEEYDFLASLLGIGALGPYLIRACARWAVGAASQIGTSMDISIPTIASTLDRTVDAILAQAEIIQEEVEASGMEHPSSPSEYDPRDPAVVENEANVDVCAYLNANMPLGEEQSGTTTADSDGIPGTEPEPGSGPASPIHTRLYTEQEQGHQATQPDPTQPDPSPGPQLLPDWVNLIQGYGGLGGTTHSFTMNLVIQMAVHQHMPNAIGDMVANVAPLEEIMASLNAMHQLPGGDNMVAMLHAMVAEVTPQQVNQLLVDVGINVGDHIVLPNYLVDTVQEETLNMWGIHGQFDQWQPAMAAWVAEQDQVPPPVPTLTTLEGHHADAIQSGMQSSNPMLVFNALSLLRHHHIIEPPGDEPWQDALPREQVDEFMENIGYLARLNAGLCWNPRMYSALRATTVAHIGQHLPQYDATHIQIQIHRGTNNNLVRVTLIGPGAYDVAISLADYYPFNNNNPIAVRDTATILATGFRTMTFISDHDPRLRDWMNNIVTMLVRNPVSLLFTYGRSMESLEERRRQFQVALAGRGRGRSPGPGAGRGPGPGAGRGRGAFRPPRPRDN